jgi:hypothetical protein
MAPDGPATTSWDSGLAEGAADGAAAGLEPPQAATAIANAATSGRSRRRGLVGVRSFTVAMSLLSPAARRLEAA